MVVICGCIKAIRGFVGFHKVRVADPDAGQNGPHQPRKVRALGARWRRKNKPTRKRW